jgi:pimeloyl-ACP methyl ester carboxylesterase
MIHGFGGTGMVFYRMIGVLRKIFRITTIDLLG